MIENFSSNINEVIRVISSLFFRKDSTAKKQNTKTHTTFLNTLKKHLRRRKSLTRVFMLFIRIKNI